MWHFRCCFWECVPSLKCVVTSDGSRKACKAQVPAWLSTCIVRCLRNHFRGQCAGNDSAFRALLHKHGWSEWRIPCKTVLSLGLASAVQLQSQVIAPIQSRFELLEEIYVPIDSAAIEGAARTILTKVSDS